MKVDEDGNVSRLKTAVLLSKAIDLLSSRQIWLHDRATSGGTLVNQSFITEPYKLKHGDVFQIAERKFRLELPKGITKVNQPLKKVGC